MPDIKTALQQALSKTANTWAADDEAHQKIAPVPVTPPKDTAVPKKYFQTTNNVTRATFDHVHKNPGKTRKEIVTALESQGYKRASTTSLLGQFLRSGAMVERGDILFTTRSDYTPLKSTIRKKVAAVKPQVKVAGLASIAPVVTADAPLPRKHIELVSKRTGEIINPRKEEWTVESVIDKLSVKQARALYDELRKIFGG
jgi:hypothetical protein